MLQDSISTAQLALSAGSVLVAYVFFSIIVLPLISTQGKWLSSQKWVGLKKQWFSQYRAGFSTLRNTREMLYSGTEVNYDHPYHLYDDMLMVHSI